jgi:predicted aconitase with swiveling domain
MHGGSIQGVMIVLPYGRGSGALCLGGAAIGGLL